MKLTPSSTARLSVAMAWSRLAGSPQMPDPVIRMAPNPMRLTVRSPPTSMVPAAVAVGCALTRYLLFLARQPLMARRYPRPWGGNSGSPRVRSAALRAVRLLGRRGRPAGDRHAGLEMFRQAGHVRLPEAAEDLHDPDPFRGRGIDHLTLAGFSRAEKIDRICARARLIGDLDLQVVPFPQGDRPGQHFRAHHRHVPPLRAGRDDRELPAPLIGPPRYDPQRGFRQRRGSGRSRTRQPYDGARGHDDGQGTSHRLNQPPEIELPGLPAWPSF